MMFLINKCGIIFSVCASLFLFSCKKNGDTPEVNNNLFKVGEAYAASIKVVLYADDSLHAGYNNLYVSLYDSANAGQKITDASVTFSPEMSMNMGAMKHGCPFENPVKSTNDLFAGAVAFTMASSNMGSWSLKVQVTDNTHSKSGEVGFNLSVGTSVNAGIKNIKLPDATQLTIAVVQPQNPKVGANDFELAVYKKQTSYIFIPATEYTFSAEPEMPSMGHGSPGNVNPALISPGHYKGLVNYTMTGDWRINLTVQQADNVVYSGLYFDQYVN
jgi:hypothetical protein